MIRLKRMAKTSFIYPLLRPRRFMMYCVGPAKSGTVSVEWNVLCKLPRSAAGEAAFREIIVLAVDCLEGRLKKSAVLRQLRRRDRRLRLEVDSFNQLSVFVQEFVDQFPQAKFLLTAREPRSWLRSIINQHLNVDVSNRQPESNSSFFSCYICFVEFVCFVSGYRLETSTLRCWLMIDLSHDRGSLAVRRNLACGN